MNRDVGMRTNGLSYVGIYNRVSQDKSGCNLQPEAR